MKWGADLSPSCEGWSQTHQRKRLLPVLYYANKGFKLLKNFVKNQRVAWRLTQNMFFHNFLLHVTYELPL
jgi:hypothetical protein